MIKVELLREEDEESYSNFLCQCENSMAQHTLEWRDVVKELLGDTPYYFIAKENNQIVGALPSFIKESAIGNIINSVPFAGGYGGVIVRSDIRDKENIYETLLDYAIYFAKNKECILMTIITSPFSYDFDIYIRKFKPDFILEKFMQYIDLDRTLSYKKNIHRKIKKAVKSNIKVIEDVSIGDLNQFYEIYKKRLLILDGPVYPAACFEIIHKYLKKQKFLFAEYKGKIISGILLVYHDEIIDYFMAAMNDAYSFTEANTLLIDYAIKWSKENGFKYWNWQSSPSKESDVYKFKARWGGDDGKHYYLTKIIGDISNLKKCALNNIKKEYEWHFVMPYDNFIAYGVDE